MKDMLLELIAHMRWADALVATALIDEPKLRNADPDPDAVRLFAHVASVEHLWYSRIFERPPAHTVWPSLTPQQSRDLAAEHADLFERLVADSDAQSLEKTVPYINSAGRSYRSSIRHIVMHSAAHGSYHRGQIALRIRAAGGTPPYTDFIQFTRE